MKSNKNVINNDEYENDNESGQTFNFMEDHLSEMKMKIMITGR